METRLQRQSRLLWLEKQSRLMPLEKLYGDVLINIVSRLSHRDVIRMTSVSKTCKKIFSITSPQLPWLMMLANPDVESSEKEESARRFFSLSDNTIYSIGIPQIRHKHCCGCFMNAGGWLMTVDKHTVIRLVYPWGRRIIQRNLPPSDVLREHVDEADKEMFSLFSSFENTLVKKAALSDDTKFLVVLNGLGKAFLYRRGDDVWTEFSKLPNTIMVNLRFDDVIFHKGNFYVVDASGSVGLLRTNDAKLEHVDLKVMPYNNDLIRNYLVGDSTSDRLYLVERMGKLFDWDSGDRTTGFNVYEIKIGEKKIKETLTVVQGLDDGVIFLGLNSSLLVMASQFTGNIRRNCIYFSDDTPLQHSYYRRKGNTPPDMGIFHMENKRIDGLFKERTYHPRFSMPLWITPPPVRRQGPLGASGASSSGKS